MPIKASDMSPELRSKLKLRQVRETTFTKNDVRSNALKALGAISSLSQSERKRVLRQAATLNEI